MNYSDVVQKMLNTSNVHKEENEEKKEYTILEDKEVIDSNLSLECVEKDIAIIGLSGKYPMADNLKEFWMNLKNGTDCITEIPSDRWDYKKYFDSDKQKKGKTYTKWGGFINDIDKFDPLFLKFHLKKQSYWILKKGYF